MSNIDYLKYEALKITRKILETELGFYIPNKSIKIKLCHKPEKHLSEVCQIKFSKNILLITDKI